MLKNLFKLRKAPENTDSGDEPARFAAPPLPSVDELKKRTSERLKSKGGFDPYNSGTFKKEDAWERVTRK